MRQWYYTKMGLQQGPVPESELLQKIRRKEIGAENLVWSDGMTDWLPVSKVPELHEITTSALPTNMEQTNPVFEPSQQERGNIPLPQPPAYQGDFFAPKISNYLWQSIVALVVSGVLMMTVCLPVGMPFAIVALVYASRVDGLRVRGMLVEAESASKSAKMWMIVSFGLSGLIILGLITGIIFLLLDM